MISNCAAAGHDSYVQPITGAVSRKDPVTGVTQAASVRANGVPEQPVKPASANTVSGASMAALFEEPLEPVTSVAAVKAYGG